MNLDMEIFCKLEYEILNLKMRKRYPSGDLMSSPLDIFECALYMQQNTDLKTEYYFAVMLRIINLCHEFEIEKEHYTEFFPELNDIIDLALDAYINLTKNIRKNYMECNNIGE